MKRMEYIEEKPKKEKAMKTQQPVQKFAKKLQPAKKATKIRKKG